MSKILIVEDEESPLQIWRKIIWNFRGFEVEIENQGDTGLVRAMQGGF